MRTFTDAERRQIAQAYVDAPTNAHARAIVAEHGLTVQTVRKWGRQIGLPQRKRGLEPAHLRNTQPVDQERTPMTDDTNVTQLHPSLLDPDDTCTADEELDPYAVTLSLDPDEFDVLFVLAAIEGTDPYTALSNVVTRGLAAAADDHVARLVVVIREIRAERGE